MKAIWDCDSAPSLSKVCDILKNTYKKTWKPQTVSTFFNKLVTKKYIKLTRKGKSYTYKILISEDQYKQKLYTDYIHFWYNDNSFDLLWEMYLNGDLTKENIDEITSNCLD
ncbi:MAG: BlaI/MecI/CopY family transcriptional regulator [Lachnospiraceae bacterium]|nr:BlaI/MecI/CopY family transcriptional regulator [Lachnospiraceae bacterium]